MSAELHDMTDFQIAKDVIKQVPRILNLLDNSFDKLNNFQHYRDVAIVLDSIVEAQISLAMHLDFYQKIYDNKGKMNG
jgi:hypothetical protein